MACLRLVPCALGPFIEGRTYIVASAEIGWRGWTHANTSIRDHASIGKDLLLFERFQRTGGYWRFAGRLQFHAFKIEQRTDKTGSPRQAIVFGLLAVPNESVSPKVFDDTLKPYSPEFAGSTVFKTSERSVEAHWVHGKVIHSLAATLTAWGYVPKKSQAVDLAVVADSGSMVVAFEAKTDTDTYSVYTAIGQLMYHSAHEPRARKVMVIPLLPVTHAQRLELLGITVLTYVREADEIVLDRVALERILADAPPKVQDTLLAAAPPSPT